MDPPTLAPRTPQRNMCEVRQKTRSSEDQREFVVETRCVRLASRRSKRVARVRSRVLGRSDPELYCNSHCPRSPQGRQWKLTSTSHVAWNLRRPFRRPSPSRSKDPLASASPGAPESCEPNPPKRPLLIEGRWGVLSTSPFTIHTSPNGLGLPPTNKLAS